jgi:uncharacterized protein YbjT (DUF2867 family)
MEIKAIVTGATGMVGEGVLHECLQHPNVTEVLVVGRKSCKVTHPKLKEILLPNFSQAATIKDQLKGYNACYFCLGVTSIGKKEPEYYRLTYVLTVDFAKLLSEQNADMTFCYISGAGTDSTEKGRQMWARVKGKTENDLLKLPFKQVFNFRPGYIQPTKGLMNAHAFYKYIDWLYPLLRPVFPTYMCTLSEIGKAMINITHSGYQQPIMEVKDIIIASKQ